MIILAPYFMTKICKKAAKHFHCAVSKVFDRVKSVVLWSANIRKLAKDYKGYGSAANLQVVYYNCIKFHKTPISRFRRGCAYKVHKPPFVKV